MADLSLSPKVKFWKDEIELYERTADKWLKRGRKILKRYKDIRSGRGEEQASRFNILWSNVQTRLPALYARDPIPEAERRFKDKDPVGRQAAEVLERCLDYTVQHVNPFGRVMRQAILDWELPGRGTVWVRYVPHFHKVDLSPEQQAAPAAGAEPEGTPTVASDGVEIDEDAVEDDSEDLGYEEAITDYVYWEDFGHTWARTWEEVRAVWRRVYLTKDEIESRFKLSSKELNAIPLDWSPRNLKDAKVGQEQKKAVVYEIWDKEKKEVVWIIKNYPDALDERDDPLHLEDFFPCPPPLFANLTADELIPTPNFTFYQDQANEIDELSTRIQAIGKALKVCGIYDSSAPGLDRLLSEGVENKLIPVDGFAAMKEKGGLEGVVYLMPLKEISEALGYLREQRQTLIDDVYQITGMSDIIRGLSDPNETATAQQIKGQFSILRISDAQTEVQRFARDTIRILAEIISDYDIETIKKISGVKLLTNAEKQQLVAQLQMPPMPPMGGQPSGTPMPGGGGQLGGAGPQPPGQGANVPAPGQQPQTPNHPQVDPEKLKLLKEPSWEDVEGLLRNSVLREFRIDIETDSTIRTDEDADREARMNFLDAVSKMVGEAATVPQSMIPAVGELILFGIRGFKVARSLERVFEDAIDELANAPPKPDPEAQKAQLEAQTQIQIEQMRGQTQAQIAQAQQAAQAQEDRVRNQLEAEAKAKEVQVTSAHEAQLEALKQHHEAEKVAYETQAKERIAQADNATKIQIAQMQHEHEKGLEAMKQAHEKAITSMTQAHEANLNERKGQMSLDLEDKKGAVAEKVEGIKGENAHKVAKVKKPEEKDEKEPEKDDTHKAIKDLAEQLKRPKKIVRDKDGRISEIH